MTERDIGGVTSIRSVNEFKFREDSDIRQLYLGGRVGGIPQVIFDGSAINPLLVAQEMNKKKMSKGNLVVENEKHI